ncbi:hypothetical protein CLF_108815 [Clonorchis sinensis]|uniref:Uncharacterized protein n=1 Tax=Clonorchis sinensis TaxID=79923 RepID=G7YIK7_CLOSI|nr:hypothetical protein CLF_108815 [Clonorchis sinensis]
MKDAMLTAFEAVRPRSMAHPNGHEILPRSAAIVEARETIRARNDCGGKVQIPQTQDDKEPGNWHRALVGGEITEINRTPFQLTQLINWSEKRVLVKRSPKRIGPQSSHRNILGTKKALLLDDFCSKISGMMRKNPKKESIDGDFYFQKDKVSGDISVRMFQGPHDVSAGFDSQPYHSKNKPVYPKIQETLQLHITHRQSALRLLYRYYFISHKAACISFNGPPGCAFTSALLTELHITPNIKKGAALALMQLDAYRNKVVTVSENLLVAQGSLPEAGFGYQYWAGYSAKNKSYTAPLVGSVSESKEQNVRGPRIDLTQLSRIKDEWMTNTDRIAADRLSRSEVKPSLTVFRLLNARTFSDRMKKRLPQDGSHELPQPLPTLLLDFRKVFDIATSLLT